MTTASARIAGEGQEHDLVTPPHHGAGTQPSRFFTNLLVGVTAFYIVVTSVSPYLYGWLIGPMLACACPIALLAAGRIPLGGYLWTIALTCLGLIGSLLGYIWGNPGVTQTLSIYVLEPFVLGVFFCSVATIGTWRNALIRILDIAALGVAVVGILMFLAFAVGVDMPEWIIGERHRTVDLSQGVARTNYQGYGSLAFLAPYAIMRFALSRRSERRIWPIVILIPTIAGVLLSGRNIYFIAIPVACLTVWFVRRQAMTRRPARNTALPGALRWLVMAGLFGLFLVAFTALIGMDLRSLSNRMVSQIDLADGSAVRGGQAEFLLDAWGDRPIFGHGAGAVVPGMIRNVESPWTFELTYLTMLLCFGMVGFLVLTIWGAWVLWRLAPLSVCADGGSAAILAGFVGSVIAASINPYLTKIDGMWMVMVPFAIASVAPQLRKDPNR